MPDKKLTDNDVVKALELEVNKKSCIHEEYEEACGLWCKHYHKWCEDMSGKNKKDNCSAFKPTAPTKRAKAILDLINRLQAENERLKDCIDEQDIEIARLWKKIDEAKAEAYKEFAEIVKARQKELLPFIYANAFCVAIDNRLKELVGENK